MSTATDCARRGSIRRIRLSLLCVAVGFSIVPFSPASASDEPNLDIAGFEATSVDGDTTAAIVGVADPAAVDDLGNVVGRTPTEVADGIYAIDVDMGDLDDVSALAGVAYVEPDYRFTVDTTDLDEGTGVTDRIGADGFHGGFSTAPTVGVIVDVDIAVLDTGVNEHSDLDVVAAYDCLTGACVTAADPVDVFGHGTKVAGQAAAIDDGIDTGSEAIVGTAPGARIWSLQVLGDDGYGSTSSIVAALDWLVDHGGIEVANMSFGCGCYSWAMSEAMGRAEAAGIVLVASAGNDNAQVLDGSWTPGGSNHAITVAAMSDTDGEPGSAGAPWCDYDDTLASFSNWGAGVDVAAPGVCVRSTNKDGGYSTWSGTSASSPVVAGVVASLIAGGGFAATSGRRSEVLGALIDHYSVPADSTCGYTDVHGARPLPPLVMMSGCGAYAVPTPQATPTTDPLGFVVSFGATAQPVSDYVVQLDAGDGWADTAGGNETGAAGTFQVSGGELDVYRVRMRAVDTEGYPSTSEPVSVTVPDVTAPAVALTTVVDDESPSDVSIVVGVDDLSPVAVLVERRPAGGGAWTTVATQARSTDAAPTPVGGCAEWDYRATVTDTYANTGTADAFAQTCVPVGDPPPDTLGHTFAADAAWLVQTGVSRGCNLTGDFCPDDVVTRGQMAAFLHRAYPNLRLIRPSTTFADTADSVFAADIDWLYRTGITHGCSGIAYCPDMPVTRGQMAAFLHRGLDPASTSDSTTSMFVDADASGFAADIAWIASVGITKGCGAARYCPEDPVTRGQMAAFLHRAADLG